MLIIFDREIVWDASILSVWADCDGDRILCTAGRETINELAGYTHASSPEIRGKKLAIANLLKPSFEHTIKIGAFQPGYAKAVFVGPGEIIRGAQPATAYYVNWTRDGKTSRFAHPHASLESALDFACEAFKLECSEIWIIDDNGRRVAERIDIAKYADRTGKPYN